MLCFAVGARVPAGRRYGGSGSDSAGSHPVQEPRCFHFHANGGPGLFVCRQQANRTKAPAHGTHQTLLPRGLHMRRRPPRGAQHPLLPGLGHQRLLPCLIHSYCAPARPRRSHSARCATPRGVPPAPSHVRFVNAPTACSALRLCLCRPFIVEVPPFNTLPLLLAMQILTLFDSPALLSAWRAW